MGTERRDPPVPLTVAADVIRALLAAIENLERARERHRLAEPGDTQSHLRGCVVLMAKARLAAEEFLKPSTSDFC